MTTDRWNVRSGADIGRAIADLRAESGVRQQDLAESLGLRRDWLAKIENGRSAVVLEHMLRALRRLGAHITIERDAPGA
ncbi:MAG TPA: helix-turn-helix domain-containing protein [Acidimicrobiia bacterium]